MRQSRRECHRKEIDVKIARLFLVMLALTVSAMASDLGGGSFGTNSPNDGRDGSSSTTCDWYWIDCGNGDTDSCCGDLGSCWDYCDRTCGGPCEYVPNEN